MPIRNAVSASNGTLNTLVSGSVVGGTTIFLGRASKKIATLSARVQLTAATASLTMATKWQTSDDGSTWEDWTNGPQNAASVVITTGTSALVKKIVPPPDGIYGKAYARIAIVTGGATGGSSDLYVIDYSYRQLTGSDNGA